MAVTKQSGGYRIVTRRLAVHNLLRDVVYHWANTALRNDPVSEAKYRALRDRGHDHHRALRTVADRLLYVACATGPCSTRSTSGPGVLRVSPAAAPGRPGRPTTHGEKYRGLAEENAKKSLGRQVNSPTVASRPPPCPTRPSSPASPLQPGGTRCRDTDVS